MVAAGIWAIVVWFQWRLHDEAKLVVGCRHSKGKLKACIPDYVGRMTALIWFCDSCPLQIPLKLHRRGKLWLLEEDRDKPTDDSS